jgi:hypothetical protein
MKIKTNYVWILIAVAIVASIIIFSPKDGTTPVDQMITTDQVLDTTPVATASSSIKTAPVVTLSYEHALAQYVDKRIQFDSRCQATPSQVTYKNGTSIMLDNRASVARTIKIGNLVVIPAYGFKIIQISSATLPATWLVDCGSSQNVATLVVQK